MKSDADPRHTRRIAVVQELFALSFNQQPVHETLTKAIVRKESSLDQLIAKAAPAWEIAKIAKIDLAILRLAVYELIVAKKEPPKVIIDEAVEIAKEYGSETSHKFVNGVLGTILQWTTA